MNSLMSLGSKVSIGQALIVSLFSILLVFFMLYVISLVIELVSHIIKKFSKGKKQDVKVSSAPLTPQKDDNMDEVVAVISACIDNYSSSKNTKIVSVSHNGKTLWQTNSLINLQK